jgi:DNA-binding response OmpR family regulator
MHDAHKMILCVEDDQGLSHLIRRAFEKHFCYVDCKSSVEAALKGFDISIYRAIVLDFRLADGNGADFLRRLRQQHDHLPPVIMMSAYQPDIDHLSKNLGCSSCIEKDSLGRFIYNLPLEVESAIEAAEHVAA